MIIYFLIIFLTKLFISTFNCIYFEFFITSAILLSFYHSIARLGLSIILIFIGISCCHLLASLFVICKIIWKIGWELLGWWSALFASLIICSLLLTHQLAIIVLYFCFDDMLRFMSFGYLIVLSWEAIAREKDLVDSWKIGLANLPYDLWKMRCCLSIYLIAIDVKDRFSVWDRRLLCVRIRHLLRGFLIWIFRKRRHYQICYNCTINLEDIN